MNLVYGANNEGRGLCICVPRCVATVLDYF
jgi:hypothetical protein